LQNTAMCPAGPPPAPLPGGLRWRAVAQHPGHGDQSGPTRALSGGAPGNTTTWVAARRGPVRRPGHVV